MIWLALRIGSLTKHAIRERLPYVGCVIAGTIDELRETEHKQVGLRQARVEYQGGLRQGGHRYSEHDWNRVSFI